MARNVRKTSRGKPRSAANVSRPTRSPSTRVRRVVRAKTPGAGKKVLKPRASTRKAAPRKAAAKPRQVQALRLDLAAASGLQGLPANINTRTLRSRF